MREAGPEFREFDEAIRRRVAAEREHRVPFPEGLDPRQSELQQHLSSLTAEFERLSSRHEQTVADQLAEIEASFNSRQDELDREHRDILRQIEREFRQQHTEVEQQYQDSTWVASSVLDDTAENSPRRQFEKFKSLLLKAREEQIAEWSDLDAAFKAATERARWQGGPPTEPQEAPADRDAAQARFAEALGRARELLRASERRLLPKLFHGPRPLLLFLGLTPALFLPLFFLIPPDLLGGSPERMSAGWAAVATGLAAGAALFIELLIYTVVSSKQSDLFSQIQQAVAEAGWVHRKWLGMAKQELHERTRDFEQRDQALAKQREATVQRFTKAHAEKLESLEATRREQTATENARYARLHEQLQTEREAARQSVQTAAQQYTIQLQEWVDSGSRQLEHELETHTQQRVAESQRHWDALEKDWRAAWEQFASNLAEQSRLSREQAPPWEQLDSGGWEPATQIPRSIRFGVLDFDLSRWPDALSADPRLHPPHTRLQAPAELAFPDETSLLLKTRGVEARKAATQLMQVVLLRLLTLLPPGTLRLTILDPVGLGESFAGLMHLADFDEKLVTSRIWTETSHIEARLADLTEHMENVLQKYLRNEFGSLEEYNEMAGEVAEPYHILVISDFPAKFSEVAARRLASIVASGPRCGVYTLMSIDLEKQLPHNFQLSELEEQMRLLTWAGGAFRPADSSDGPAVLIDEPPPPPLYTRLVKEVARASKDARRVEVAFSRIAPDPPDWWTQDSRRDIDVPLGRAGATKLQHMRLGRGTSQHMLVAGKTGSGKSTFLHALITNVALHYAPDEVRFYLIDFKKGVEFKDYAELQLPHADVIAIESDREFGVSALQRLDDVLQERGERFRRAGVQDIAGFRTEQPAEPMPRILLVIDEFQEFFVEDDKLSQKASLLLDRLVRQGRAFGIHVILGSQTLGGAYSLARSTLGQVAIRVALQCSEADAHLILSEENTAARLLSRPGEAIYNDANGLLQANHPFQVAWLSDADRSKFLRQLSELAAERNLPPAAPVVFEGNIPSDPARNRQLVELLTAPAEANAAGKHLAPQVWLGEAVEIREATSFRFEPHAGHHLLLVGQDAEAACGIAATAAVTWVATLRGKSFSRDLTPVIVFDGSSDDAAESQHWQQLAKLFPGIARFTPRDTRREMEELSHELARRLEDRDALHRPLLIVVFGLSRFRDLRKSEDDYGFGGFGSEPQEKPADPGKQFADLLTDGPEVGLHTLVWCDTAANLERTLSRQSLRELEHRILFQMNAADSSNLIESPAASRLGVHRALVYHSESGDIEKFRPYGIPSIEWLRTAAGAASSDDDLEIATDLDAFTIG